MKNILVIGAGGIGSYLIDTVSNLVLHKQITSCNFVIFDDDNVETKNILYQNFTNEDILENKAAAIAKKYPNMVAVEYRIETEEHIESFGKPDLIITCVDNSSARRLVFNYCYKNNVDFIDLRSEGKAVAFYLKKDYTLENILKTLPKEDTSSGSCQLEYDLDNGIIQLGNRIVAAIGAQLLLNWLRDDLDMTHSNSIRF